MSWKKLFFTDADTATGITPEDKPVEAKKKTTTPSKTSTVPTSLSSISQVSSAPTVTQETASLSNEETEQFVEYLDEVYKKGNFPGPDFQEYVDALELIASAPMDERTKYTTIFATFKVQGITKERLIDTGTKYIKMIKDQESAFKSDVDKILTTEIPQKKNQIEILKKESTEIDNQMRQLNERKLKNNEAMQKITHDVDIEIAKLNSKKAGFEQVAQRFVAVIQDRINKIQEYLS